MHDRLLFDLSMIFVLVRNCVRARVFCFIFTFFLFLCLSYIRTGRN